MNSRELPGPFPFQESLEKTHAAEKYIWNCCIYFIVNTVLRCISIKIYIYIYVFFSVYIHTHMCVCFIVLVISFNACVFFVSLNQLSLPIALSMKK